MPPLKIISPGYFFFFFAIQDDEFHAKLFIDVATVLIFHLDNIIMCWYYIIHDITCITYYAMVFETIRKMAEVSKLALYVGFIFFTSCTTSIDEK